MTSTPTHQTGIRSANAPLSHSHDKGSDSPALIEMTIGEHFDHIVAQYPDNDALVSRHQGIRYTYRELQARATQLASAMLRSGLQKGDRVGIWSHNNAEWLVTQVATAKIGIILVNINPAYRLAEVEYALNKVGCKAIITMPSFKTSNYIGMLQELGSELAQCHPSMLALAKLPQLRQIIWIDKAGEGEDVPGMQRFSDFIARGDANDAAVADVQRTLKNTDPINIQFTSGTTGFPKGATLTHRNILNNGFMVGECIQITPADRLCCPVPLYHCFGMVMSNLTCMTHGACVVYPNDAFDPLLVLETVQAERCTALHGVPTMFIAELDHPRFSEFDLSSLRTGIMAGSPCPIEVMKRVQRDMHMEEVTIAYGMTETSPVSCQSSTNAPLDKRVSTVGLVQPHLEVKIISPETGEVVPCGESGELCTKGYSVMHGYWGDEAKTAEAIDSEGWMHTGDLATMDSDGYVNIVGRLKDMVIRGGENVYPREIEEFFYRHPKIQDVQVVGVPDQRYGEELCAWIVLKPGQQLTEDALREFCKGQIAHYKVPRYIKFVTEFPMTVTGKIQKFRIREAMKEELGLAEQKTA